MSSLSENEINAIIDKLLSYVDTLPMQDKGKAYIRAKLLIDFIDTWQFDDEANDFTFDEYLANPSNPRFAKAKSTYGIQNTTQVKRWISGFKTALIKSRGIALDKHLKKLDEMHPAHKAVKISKTLAAITRAELFQKHNIQSIKDPEWNNQLKEILGAEYHFSKEQALLLTQAQQDQIPKIEQELLIVEELETLLTKETFQFSKRCAVKAIEKKAVTRYFDHFISGPLLTEFNKTLYSRIRTLSIEDRNLYLSSSLLQFETHSPNKRRNTFTLNYRNACRNPNNLELTENDFNLYLAIQVWQNYSNHFHLFRTAFQKIYDDCRGTITSSPNQSPVISSPKSPILSFKYKNNISGSANLTDLLNSLKHSALIHQNTKLSTFRSLFSASEVEQKIIWTGNISELAHFIKTLHNTAKKVEDTKQKHWEITINCFTMEDGTELTNAKLRTQKIPAKASSIEKAVNIL